MIKSFLLIGPLLFAAHSNACTSNLDCDLGSKCIKQGGRFNGICMGGSRPGNRYDREPYSDRLRPGVGRSCSSRFDCDLGQRCAKSRSYGDGVCVD